MEIITDIEQIKQDQDLNTSIKSFAKIKAKVEALEVTGDKGKVEAIEILAQAKKVAKDLDEKRKTFVDPLNEVVKKINAEFNPKIEAVKSLVPIINGKVIAYDQEVAAAIQKENARIEAQNRKALEKFEQKVEAGKVAAPPTVRPTIEQETKVTTSTGKTMNTRTTVSFEIVDAAAIPREYLIPDEVKIRKVIQAGVPIPGIKRIEKIQYV